MAARAERRDLATPADLSEHIGVAEKTLENWRAREEGPEFIRVGGLPRYEWAAIEEWKKSRTVRTY